MNLDDIFDLVSYRIHPEAHIVVDHDACAGCTHRACTHACPARCYEWNEQRGRVDFAYESCLECGTCLLVCDPGALTWDYPAGGYGVRFRST
jgi:ferredoxin like protein